MKPSLRRPSGGEEKAARRREGSVKSPMSLLSGRSASPGAALPWPPWTGSIPCAIFLRIRGLAMAPLLHLDLLGGFSASLDRARPCTLPTRKAQALLAYLAVPAGRFHSRDKLTALFWGEAPESQARQSFRQ